MEQLILDGKSLAKKTEDQLAQRIQRLTIKGIRQPRLAVIIVGVDYASVTYVRMKCNACKRVGIDALKIELPEDTTTTELINLIERMNLNDGIDGIMVQHPLPRHIDERRVIDTISVEKDVDGLNSASFGGMSLGLNYYRPATPLSIMTILQHYGVEIQGKHAVVIGRSNILGKPVALLLLNQNATVTVCHSKTENLPDIVKQADIIVAAVGKANFVKPDWVKPCCVIVDAGYNEGNVGDVDPEAYTLASAYTPVPGGVGPMTIAMLLTQTVEAYEKKHRI